MFTPKLCHQLKNKFTEFLNQLENYNPPHLLAYIEAKYSFSHLKKILNHTPLSNIHYQLASFLVHRWRLIQNSDANYCSDFVSPINLMCIEIAKCLKDSASMSFQTHYLYFLMPSLQSEGNTTYINSPYDSDVVDLKEYILSDDKKKLINISEVLEFAQLDATFKCPYLDKKNQPIPLSAEEYRRLTSRHPSVFEAVTAIHDRKTFTYFGNTAGAAINRLIAGLENGGKRYGHDEYNAGQSAMVAIHEFNVYILSLDEATQSLIFSSGYEDRFDETSFVSIKTVWGLLTTPPETLQTPLYCVEMIAGRLKDILSQNENLFRISATPPLGVNQLSRLNKQVNQKLATMRGALASIEYHVNPNEDGNKAFYFNLIQDMLRTAYHDLTIQDLTIIATYSSRANENTCYSKKEVSKRFYKMISERLPLEWTELKNQSKPDIKSYLETVSQALQAPPEPSPFVMFKPLSRKERAAQLQAYDAMLTRNASLRTT